MSNGRFFKLNESLSMIEDGVTVFDYTEVSAYDGLEKPMSPKYPLSLIIDGDSVIFRLHYCAYRGGTRDMPKYDLSIEDLRQTGHHEIGMAHMGEAILELPYIEKASLDLTSVIKGAYLTDFPQVTIKKEKKQKDGSRYFDQLIKKENGLQGRKEAPSYSTLWLMDLSKEDGEIDLCETSMNSLIKFLRKLIPCFLLKQSSKNGIVKYLQKMIPDVLLNPNPNNDDVTKFLHKITPGFLLSDDYKNHVVVRLLRKIIPCFWSSTEPQSDEIVKFLRKLILDFMFDLKHSDVFCVSRDYDRMYSGLMSNYFFSALMHKCEFYYYRVLVEKAVDEFEKEKLEENVDKDLKSKSNELTYLYGQELFDAQTKWVNDIMNPISESCFEHRFPRWTSLLSSIFSEKLTCDRWPSWFATPEEEMRRVHFSMKEWNHWHNCNARTLIEYLHLEERIVENDVAINSMLESESENRVRVSQWFLSRFDFNDVLHLHLFKHLNLFLFFLVIVFLVSLFGGFRFGIDAAKGVFEFVMNDSLNCCHVIVAIFVIAMILYLVSRIVGCGGTILTKVNHRLYSKRLFVLIVGCYWLVMCAVKWLRISDLNGFWVNGSGWSFNDVLFMVSTIVVVVYAISKLAARLGQIRIPDLHPVRSSHLLLPKLVASITAAWLTLLTGFDVVISYYDRQSSWPIAVALTVVVFWFIMSRINRVIPTSNPSLQLFRALEFLIVSYCISFVIGLFVINFVAERYLARHGYNPEFYNSKAMVTKVIGPFDVADLRKSIEKIEKQKISDSIRARDTTAIDLAKIIGKVEPMTFVMFEDESSLCSRRLVVGDGFLAEHGVVPALYDSMVLNMVTIGPFNVTYLRKSIENGKRYQQMSDLVFARYPTAIDISKVIGKVKSMTYVRFNDDASHYLGRLAIRYHIPNSVHDLFILPRFLVMFSFFTMFIGVFLQMVFFERNQMTDF